MFLKCSRRIFIFLFFVLCNFPGNLVIQTLDAKNVQSQPWFGVHQFRTPEMTRTVVETPSTDQQSTFRSFLDSFRQFSRRNETRKEKEKSKAIRQHSTTDVSITDISYPFLDDLLPIYDQRGLDVEEGSGGNETTEVEHDAGLNFTDVNDEPTTTTTQNSSSVTPRYESYLTVPITASETLVKISTPSSQEPDDQKTTTSLSHLYNDSTTTTVSQLEYRPTSWSPWTWTFYDNNWSHAIETSTSVTKTVSTLTTTTKMMPTLTTTRHIPKLPTCPSRLQKLFFPERYITDSQVLAKWAFKCPRTDVIYNVTITNFYDDIDINILWVSTKNVTITGLRAFSSYHICVCSIVGDDPLTCSPICNNVTTHIGYPEPPQNVTIINVAAHSMRIAWNPPVRMAGPTNYTVLLVSSEDVSTTVEGVTEATLFDLEAFTNYCIMVEAITVKGTHSTVGPCQRTNPDVPERVQDLSASCRVTNCTLSWMLPVAVNGYLEYYDLSYAGIRSISKKIQIGSRIIGDITGHIVILSVDGLLADADYTFTVRAKTMDVDELGTAASCQSKTSAGVPSVSNLNTEDACDSGPNEKSQVNVNITKNLFQDDGGDVIQYVIFVAEVSKAENSRSGLRNTIPFRLWSEVKNKQYIFPYVTTPYDWNPFCIGDHWNCTSVVYTIGKDESCFQDFKLADRCNGPLRSGTTYSIKVRAYTSVGYADSQLCTISTDSNMAPVIVITVFSLLLFTLFASALVVCIQRKHIIFTMVRKKTQPSRRDEKVISVVPISVPLPVTTVKTKPVFNFANQCRLIRLCDFVENFKSMSSDSGLKFSQEFEELSVSSFTGSTKIAQLPENKIKNRWINILPFDDSRVKLLPIPDDVSTDYINASYIPGYRSPREYIATQGPLPTTKDDFWRMIWEQSSPMIVMVTQCVERGKVKCEEYWPSDREKHYYGDLAVRLKSESILSGFTIRIFDLELGTRVMEVKQMYFTMWPDFGCPENTTMLLNFVRSVRDHIPRCDVGPIVVHCSAGVGRTGTFIAVDRLMQHIQDHDAVDVYGTVLNMRQHRTNMVQTEDQYVYIHECIRDLLLEPQPLKQYPKEDDHGYVEEVYTNIEELQQESLNV